MVKIHTPPQGESISLTIGRYLPILGQRGKNIQIFIEPHQSIIDLFRDKYIGVWTCWIEFRSELIGKRFKPENATRAGFVTIVLCLNTRIKESKDKKNEKKKIKIDNNYCSDFILWDF